MASTKQQKDNPNTPSTTTQDLASLWWNTNVPPQVQTASCPSYLQYALSHDKELANLSTLDSDFTLLSWSEVKDIVSSNSLDRLRRVPSDLRRYRIFTEHVVQQWGSVERFVKEARLGWSGEGVEGRFGSERNYRILPNDWPYGLDGGISHLVIWTKFSLDWEGSERDIEWFVDEMFRRVCGGENVVWFRNPGYLRSVDAVEHFHVLLNHPPYGFVRQITGGEVAMSQRQTVDVPDPRNGTNF